MTRQHPPVKPHQHGTITGYSYGCRDDCCRAANTARMARLRKAAAMRVEFATQRVDGTPVRQTLEQLREIGHRDRQIARYAGLNHVHVTRLRTGQQGKYVTRETAQRIIQAAERLSAMPAVDLLAARYVDACGARHRIRALMTQGWSHDELGRRLGHSGGYLSPLLYTERRITPGLHQAIAALYDHLWQQPGPSTSTARRAASRGWATPLELDDDLIDDPTYAPVLHRLDPVTARIQARDERRERVAELTARGLSIRQISDELRVDRRQVIRDRALLREAS